MRNYVLFHIAILHFLITLPTVFSANITVKQDGTGDTQTIQAALNAAQNGDTIIIGDSKTYVEDLTASPFLAQVGVPAAAVSSFTLMAADGVKPVIQAANAETSQRMSVLGLTGRDMLGFAIWGCQGVTIQGIEIVNLENEVNAFNVQSSLVIVDSDRVTVQDCTVRGPNQKSAHEGNAILIAGVQAQPYLTDNITIKDCLITESHYGIISAIFVKGSGVDPNRVTIENCQFLNGFESGIDVDNAQQMVIRNCFFDYYNHGVHFAGGNSLVEDCTILNTRSYGLECRVDTNWTDKITAAIVRRCAIIGSGYDEEAAGIRCSDGTLQFENCIIAGSSGSGILVTPDSVSDINASFDHCDIYENLGLAEVLLELKGEYIVKMTLTNSNIVSSGNGIENQLENSAIVAHHNNVFVDGEAYVFVDPTDSLSVDPLYVSPTNDPTQFSQSDFDLQDTSPVLTAGEEGSAIGSQGIPDTHIDIWHLF